MLAAWLVGFFGFFVSGIYDEVRTSEERRFYPYCFIRW